MRPISLILGALLPLGALSASVLQVNSNELADKPVTVQSSWDWEDCGDPEDKVEIKSIKVNPDPPEVGNDMTVTVDVNVKERIEDGAYVDVLVKVGVIKILQQEFDLCEEARKAETDVQCPVEAGSYTIEQTVTLPKEIPRAKFVVSAIGYTVEDENLACVNLHVDFRPKFPHIW